MLRRSVVVFALLVVVSVMLQAQFEGNIAMQMTSFENSKPQVTNAKMHVKNDLLLLETEGEEEGGRVILRGDKQVLWVIADEHQMYLEISLKEHSEKKVQPHKEKMTSNVKKTGKTQMLLGYECEEWVAEEGEEITSVWGTTKLGNIYQGIAKAMGGMSGMGGEGEENIRDWQKEILEKNFFPLKVEVKENGKMKSSQVITKVEPKTLPVSMFEPPVGYQKHSMDLDLQKMMKQMQQQKDE